MGALDYLSNLCRVSSTRSKRKTMQTVEIKVKMDCDGCERRVRTAVTTVEGVKSVEVNRMQHRVTVRGYVDPSKVLKRLKSIGKRAEFWPYTPQHLVNNPIVPEAYDKTAPPGFVRNIFQSLPAPIAPDDNIVSLFSDDNVNACYIM